MSKLMPAFNNIYDISIILGSESIDYPGDTPYSRTPVVSLKDGGGYNLSRLAMTAHSGTHIDIPLHFLQTTKSIEKYAIEDFILPALVIEAKSSKIVQLEELEGQGIKAGDAVLLKTGNSVSGRNRTGKYSRDFVYLSAEAAEYCIQQKIKLIGIDYVTVEKSPDATFPVHHRLLENDIFILEHINLEHIQTGRYTLLCLPLKIKDAEASPVRAVLLR
jgi:arylformamidase